MIISDKELPTLPGFNNDLNPKKGKENHISISVTREQIETLGGEFGIDVEALVKNAIIGEIYLELSKHINRKVFENSSNFDAIPFGDNPYETFYPFLDEETDDGFGFILTNVMLASIIQDHEDFDPEPLETQIRGGAGLYSIGYIKDYRVWIDPMMLYNDTRIAFVTNNFWNYSDSPTIQVISEATLAPKIMAKTLGNFKKARSRVFEINNAKF